MNIIILCCILETIMNSLAVSKDSNPSPSPSLQIPEDRAFDSEKDYKDRLQHPYFVSIFMCDPATSKCPKLCTGSILNVKMILTACHCTMDMVDKQVRYRDPKNIGVVAGVKPQKQVNWAKTIHLHPKCWIEGQPAIHDVAILVLQKPFTQEEIVKPVKFFSDTPGYSMMELYRLALSETKCYALSEGQNPNSIQVVDVTPISTTTCQRLYCENRYSEMCNHNFQSYGQVCAIVANGEKIPCNIKGGGPLICGEAYYGVASYAPPCGETRLPMIFAHIDSVQELISQKAPEMLRLRTNPNSTERPVPTFLNVLVLIYNIIFRA